MFTIFIVIGIVIAFHLVLHFVNPYVNPTLFKSPYKTTINEENGQIEYTQSYKMTVLTGPLSDLLGYYRSGFLIVQNTLTGGKPVKSSSPDKIIRTIHQRRFDPSKPYLISGDQFSVLYPRNLGVFYNQLLDPNTALSETDWENRQQIYLKSVLFALDGLSASDRQQTTLVPIAPRTIAMTTVHPGDVASDAVYGTLFALNRLASEQRSDDGRYEIKTQHSTQRILRERSEQLRFLVDSYISSVVDHKTGLVRSDIHLSSARDGASRKSSFYDNVILWKTLELANNLGIKKTPLKQLNSLRSKIQNRYWNESAGYYNNDIEDQSFSSDWLIGYVTGFFDLSNNTDIAHTSRVLKYIEKYNLASPLPIKYQDGEPRDSPWIIKTFVPNYGGNMIWSYWGAQYITLLVDMYKSTGNELFLDKAHESIVAYKKVIVRDGGFAETFDEDGQFFQRGPYKSIRITGWVVQFEHAVYEYEQRTESVRNKVSPSI